MLPSSDHYPTGIPVAIPVTTGIRVFAGILVPAKFHFFAGIPGRDFTLNLVTKTCQKIKIFQQKFDKKRDKKSIPVESRQTRFCRQSRYQFIPVPAKMVQSLHYTGTGQNSYPGRILHQMPSDYTPKGAATRLVGRGELNFTDQILLANRVGLAIRQCYSQTYCEMEHNCYDGLIS